MTTHYDFLTGDGERDRRNVDLILGAVEELNSQGDIVAKMRSAVDRAILLTGAGRGILMLPDEKGALAVKVARKSGGEDLPVTLNYSRTITGKVWSTGKPFLTLDAAGVREGASALRGSIVDLRLVSVLVVPLPVKGRSIGVLYVDSTAKVKEFTDADLTVFEALAALVAVAIENALLAAKEAERQRMEREMAVARTIQQGLFPKDLKAPPGYDLAAEGRPCEETSGDYYDVIPLGGGRIALVMGDVSGHGLGAALFMTSVRALLHTLLHLSSDLRAALAGINAFLCRDMPEGSFMSLFLGLLDAEAKTFSYVSAGHNPPYIWRRGMPLLSLAKTGPVLGVIEGHAYRLSDLVALKSGDALVLYTDGIYEAHSAAGEMYGEDRYVSSIDRHASSGRDAKAILRGLLTDLDGFVRGEPMQDDVTCLVLRVTENGVPAGAAQ